MATLEELLALAEKGELKKARRKPSCEEHRLQCAEVRYMRSAHRELSRVFFCVPNGQKRTVRQAAWLHDEGLVNGVSDMILLKPNSKHGYLCIENKTRTGRQSPDQILFQQAVESHGGKYVVVRSLDEFIRNIEDYLNGEL